MKRSGRGAAWLARLLGVQEVPGSNPGGPTKANSFNRLALGILPWGFYKYLLSWR
jgi:hypothetical protein